MPYSNSASKACLGSGPVLLLLLLVASTPGRAESGGQDNPWLWQPWIGTAAGYESDLILDPDLTRQIVPGGAFLELSPGFRLTRPLSRSTAFRLLNRNTVERFFNADNRTLFASSLFGDFRFKSQSAFRGRATLNGDYFNDSGSASFRRLSGGAEVGAGAQFARWEFEVSGYVQGRRYPNVQILTANLQSEIYTESHRGIGGHFVWSPLSDLLLRGVYNRRTTDSGNPAFESTSYTASGSLEYLIANDIWISGNVTGQSREFANRNPGEDEDSYIQFGVGASRAIKPHIYLSLRYARSAYTYPLGGQQTTDRITAGLTWQFGKKAPAIRRLTSDPVRAARGVHQEGVPILFRIHAPGVQSVALVGTFNNWNPEANPLRMSDAGWWETDLTIGPGVHEYLYLVDGEPVIPPEAKRTVEDGFGGRNGVVEIIPSQR